MLGSSPLGKFGPLALIVVVQLLLVLALPSTAPSQQQTVGYGTSSGGGSATGGVAAAGGNGAGSTTTAGTAAGVAGSGGSGGGASGAAGPAGSGAPTSAAAASAVGIGTDTTHCVDGRQFNPAIDFFAPPCVPGTVGAADSRNGGATWQGVTGKTIEIVNYVSDYGAEVDAILKAQGLYYNAQQAATWNAAYAKFINTHYQLYGRKVHIDTMQGGCQTVPPDYQCLIGDMDKLVSTYHPYAVLWSTTLCSACFAELSRLHVVNFGGSGFSDAFHDANAPYSYEATETASRTEEQFAHWWCAQMAGHKATFAGTENPAENFRNSTRALGVVSTNDPDNEATVKNVLLPALQRDCGVQVSHLYFYAQDINTATQQSQQSEQAMNTPTNPATSVLCLCDPVAPQFGMNAYANNNYWPESILASDQTMDWDPIAQTYDQTLACPQPQRGCGWDNAVGLSADDVLGPPAQMAGVKVYEAATGSSTLPVAADTLQIFWDNYNMIASLIENTGPYLTPARMQAAAPSLGARGGGTTGYPLRAFAPGDWGWTQDVRIAYWDASRVSPYNGVKGTYVPIEGSRFNMSFPSMAQPPAPEPENRTS